MKDIIGAKSIYDIRNTMFEEIGLEWTTIKNWENERKKYGFENECLYIQYTTELKKGNQMIAPTSFAILDKNLAKEIFGFEPIYVNYNTSEGFNEGYFMFKAQSQKIVW